MPADLRTMDAPRRLADQALALFGSVDILVNNAGLVFVADLLQSTVEHWQQT